MFLLDLTSAARRTKRIARAQEDLNRRLLADAGFAQAQSLHPRHAALGQWITSSAGGRVLELGCGPGRYVAMLSSLGFDVVGVDPFSFDFWACLRAKSNITLLPEVRAESLPFEDESFDHVCCLGALLYFDDPAAALMEMARVLKPGGRLVLRSVNKENRFTLRTGRRLDPASRNLYSLPEMTSLVEGHRFSVEHSFQYGYYPSKLVGLYWYFLNVHAHPAWEEMLNNRLLPQHRVNNVIHAIRS